MITVAACNYWELTIVGSCLYWELVLAGNCLYWEPRTPVRGKPSSLYDINIFVICLQSYANPFATWLQSTIAMRLCNLVAKKGISSAGFYP